MEKKQYVCPKCGCKEYEHDQFQATGGNFAQLCRTKNLLPSAAKTAAIQNCIKTRQAGTFWTS